MKHIACRSLPITNKDPVKGKKDSETYSKAARKKKKEKAEIDGCISDNY